MNGETRADVVIFGAFAGAAALLWLMARGDGTAASILPQVGTREVTLPNGTTITLPSITWPDLGGRRTIALPGGNRYAYQGGDINVSLPDLSDHPATFGGCGCPKGNAREIWGSDATMAAAIGADTGLIDQLRNGIANGWN